MNSADMFLTSSERQYGGRCSCSRPSAGVKVGEDEGGGERSAECRPRPCRRSSNTRQGDSRVRCRASNSDSDFGKDDLMAAHSVCPRVIGPLLRHLETIMLSCDHIKMNGGDGEQ